MNILGQSKCLAALLLLGAVLETMTTTRPLAAHALSATTTRVVYWGVVLGGTADQDKTTLRAFRDLPGAKLVAVMDPPGSSVTKAKDDDDEDEVLTATTTVRRYDRRDDFLADERIDAVWIDTPPGQHVYWAMHVASIRHSLPHVTDPPRFIGVGRPLLGRSADETATLAAALQARKLVLLPAPLASLQDRFTWMQQAVALQELVGDLESVNYQYTMTELDDSSSSCKADVHGGGVVLELAPVVLKFLEMLLGPLDGVKGEALNRNSPDQDVEDYVWMQAQAGSVGVHAIWDMTRNNAPVPVKDCLVLRGAKGSLRVHGLVTESVVEIHRDDWDADAADTLTARRDFGHTPLSGTRACVEEVTERILQRDKPQTDLRATFRLASHVDRILKSYYGGRGDDFFARPATWPGIPPARRQLYLDQKRKG